MTMTGSVSLKMSVVAVTPAFFGRTKFPGIYATKAKLGTGLIQNYGPAGNTNLFLSSLMNTKDIDMAEMQVYMLRCVLSLQDLQTDTTNTRRGFEWQG